LDLFGTPASFLLNITSTNLNENLTNLDFYNYGDINLQFPFAIRMLNNSDIRTYSSTAGINLLGGFYNAVDIINSFYGNSIGGININLGSQNGLNTLSLLNSYIHGGNITINVSVLNLANSSILQAGNIILNLQNLTVDTSSIINASGLGYLGVTTSDGLGPGYGTSSGYGGTGAGHGGSGGPHGNRGGGVAYGSSLAPVTFGSSGGAYSAGGAGGSGGGAIIITVSNTFNLSGIVRTEGQIAVGTHSGGGAGGSIYVITNNLVGNGNFIANGGAGLNEGGGGAGGRIAVYYNSSSFVGISGSMVSGGAGGSTDPIGRAGQPGTLIFVDQDDNSATIKQSFKFQGLTMIANESTNTTFWNTGNPGFWNFSNLIIYGGATIYTHNVSINVSVNYLNVTNSSGFTWTYLGLLQAFY